MIFFLRHFRPEIQESQIRFVHDKCKLVVAKSLEAAKANLYEAEKARTFNEDLITLSFNGQTPGNIYAVPEHLIADCLIQNAVAGCPYPDGKGGYAIPYPGTADLASIFEFIDQLPYIDQFRKYCLTPVERGTFSDDLIEKIEAYCIFRKMADSA